MPAAYGHTAQCYYQQFVRPRPYIEVRQLSYHPINDVTPISMLGHTPHLVTVHASLPVASIKELIVYDKANPGKINYGSSGTGGSEAHVTLAGELRRDARRRSWSGWSASCRVPSAGAGQVTSSCAGPSTVECRHAI